jgi:hypothetical protein
VTATAPGAVLPLRRPNWPKADNGKFVGIPQSVKALQVPLLRDWWPSRHDDGGWTYTGTVWAEDRCDFTALLALAKVLDDVAFPVVDHDDWQDVSVVGRADGHRVRVTVRTDKKPPVDPDGYTTLAALKQLAEAEEPLPDLSQPLVIELGGLWDTPMPLLAVDDSDPGGAA